MVWRLLDLLVRAGGTRFMKGSTIDGLEKFHAKSEEVGREHA